MQICREYEKGATQVQLAKKYDIEKKEIRKILVKHNIPIRKAKRPIKEVAIIVVIGLILWFILNFIAYL